MGILLSVTCTRLAKNWAPVTGAPFNKCSPLLPVFVVLRATSQELTSLMSLLPKSNILGKEGSGYICSTVCHKIM